MEYKDNICSLGILSIDVHPKQDWSQNGVASLLLIHHVLITHVNLGDLYFSFTHRKEEDFITEQTQEMKASSIL